MSFVVSGMTIPLGLGSGSLVQLFNISNWNSGFRELFWISNFVVLFYCLLSFVLGVRLHYSLKERKQYIDYDLSLILLPSILFGIYFGSVISIISVKWLSLLFFSLSNFFSLYQLHNR